MKKVIYATIGIFVVWSIWDYLIHGVLLQDLYDQTKNLWRPMEEIRSNWWMYLISLTCAFIFSWLWCCNTGKDHKTIKGGAIFGTKIGLIFGLSMGFGMFAVMPIPLSLATAWFFSSLIAYILAGLIAASIIKDCHCLKK